MIRSRYSELRAAPAAWLLLIVSLLLAPFALAAPSGGVYTLRKFAVAGGGAAPESGAARAVVTVGQSAAHVQTGSNYRLTGGFHQRAALSDSIFRDGFESPNP